MGRLVPEIPATAPEAAILLSSSFPRLRPVMPTPHAAFSKALHFLFKNRYQSRPLRCQGSAMNVAALRPVTARAALKTLSSTRK